MYLNTTYLCWIITVEQQICIPIKNQLNISLFINILYSQYLFCLQLQLKVKLIFLVTKQIFKNTIYCRLYYDNKEFIKFTLHFNRLVYIKNI